MIKDKTVKAKRGEIMKGCLEEKRWKEKKKWMRRRGP